jgi:mannose-6-phosphate isomerase-like protein (cupin superfamily)
MIPSANFDKPDEVRTFEKGEMQVVTVDGRTVGRVTFRPGWRWSTCIKPIAGTDSCQAAHFGYVLSGAMNIHMDDGSELEVKAGDVFAIPPGHDADVPGPEACVMVDFGEIGDYAKRG